jgi:putative Mn2+ efflux pump MntP
MSFFLILMIALGMAMDAFAVALSAGTSLRVITLRQYFRLSFHFGLFQAGMPLLGWFLGKNLMALIARWDHWIAFVVLGFVGGKMIYESFHTSGGTPSRKDPTRGMRLIALSIATSLDAFAIGFSLAALGVAIIWPAFIIGLVTFLLTGIGMVTGRYFRSRLGSWVEILGGVLLILIGFKILIEHLSA